MVPFRKSAHIYIYNQERKTQIYSKEIAIVQGIYGFRSQQLKLHVNSDLAIRKGEHFLCFSGFLIFFLSNILWTIFGVHLFANFQMLKRICNILQRTMLLNWHCQGIIIGAFGTGHQSRNHLVLLDRRPLITANSFLA